MARLTPRQQAGQRVVFSYTGPTPPATLFDLIAAGEVGHELNAGHARQALRRVLELRERLG